MENFSYKDFLEFLDSNLDEIEFFGCDKQDYISLEQYLHELKLKKEEYDKLITPYLKSIQNKNKWVKEIVPSHDISLNALVIYGKIEPTFLLDIDKETQKYKRTGGLL